MKVSIRRYFAEDSGCASSTSLASGKPDHGTVMPQASTQRWRYSRSSSSTFFEVVDAELLLLLHHAVDLDRPRPQLERLRCACDLLRGAELVEIIVVDVDLLLGDGAVEH